MLNIFLLLISFAWSEDTSYTDIKEGERAPFSGILMTNGAMIQMIAVQESKFKTCELDKKTQLELQKNSTDTKYLLYEAKCTSETKMYEGLIAARDEQIKKDKTKDVIQRFAFYGGFVLGSATSIGIVYSLNQN